MIDSILAAHAETDQPGATFRAIDTTLANEPGHILFTSWCIIRHCVSRNGSTPTSEKRIRSVAASR